MRFSSKSGISFSSEAFVSVAPGSSIQAALDNLPSGGGGICLLSGVHNGKFTMPENSMVAGYGWNTVLDVSGIGATERSIEMGNGCVLRDMKIVGDIGTLETEGREILTGNGCLVENLWMSHNNYGISAMGRSDVRINGVWFDNVRGVNGWAACIHASGSERVFVRGIHAETCDRGFEVEDGSRVFYASDGYLEDIPAGGGNGNTLDAHTHEGKGTVQDVVYERFYLKDCDGLVAGGADLVDDYVQNITFRDIVLESPDLVANYCMQAGYARDVLFDNIRVISPPSGNVMACGNCEGIAFRGVKADGVATCYAVGCDGLTIEHGVFSGGLAVVGGTNRVIRNNIGYVTEGQGAIVVGDGGTIPHGCAGTPSVMSVQGSIAAEIVSVTGIDGTNITLAIKNYNGTTGTPQTVYWRAWV